MPQQGHDPILSRITFAGHPLHPMMVHFPVAALIGLAGADVAFILTGDSFWARAGLWLAGIGAGGGWVASSAGMLDLILVRRIRRLITGWAHGVMAIMMLSLASMNWLLRFEDTERHVLPWGLSLTLVTAVLIAATAALGGRLVYEHAVGVDIEV